MTGERGTRAQAKEDDGRMGRPGRIPDEGFERDDHKVLAAMTKYVGVELFVDVVRVKNEGRGTFNPGFYRLWPPVSEIRILWSSSGDTVLR